MVRAEGLLVDLQRAAHQRFGLRQTVGGFQQLGQIVEADRDIGMLGAQARLGDGQRASHQGLRLSVTVGGFQH